MSYSPYSIEERFSMITDCLQSGLAISMWCREHEIPTEAFYFLPQHFLYFFPEPHGHGSLGYIFFSTLTAFPPNP